MDPLLYFGETVRQLNPDLLVFWDTLISSEEAFIALATFLVALTINYSILSAFHIVIYNVYYQSKIYH